MAFRAWLHRRTAGSARGPDRPRPAVWWLVATAACLLAAATFLPGLWGALRLFDAPPCQDWTKGWPATGPTPHSVACIPGGRMMALPLSLASLFLIGVLLAGAVSAWHLSRPDAASPRPLRPGTAASAILFAAGAALVLGHRLGTGALEGDSGFASPWGAMRVVMTALGFFATLIALATRLARQSRQAAPEADNAH